MARTPNNYYYFGGKLRRLTLKVSMVRRNSVEQSNNNCVRTRKNHNGVNEFPGGGTKIKDKLKTIKIFNNFI